MKKLIYILLLSIFLAVPAGAQQEKVKVYFFYGEGCPHCHDELAFLSLLRYRNQHFDLREFEVWGNKENQALLKRVAAELEIQTGSVPITVINGRVIYGFRNAGSTGEQIEGIIEECWVNGCDDPVAGVVTKTNDSQKKLEPVANDPANASPQTSSDALPQKVSLPGLGEVDVRTLSLPLFTAIIGILDGFNPCAMWILLFLISLLLGMENKRRRWILGSVFILVSGLVYFVFMAAWLNVFLFLGFVFWVRVAVGSVAIASGWHYLKEYFKNKKGGCEIMSDEKRSRVFGRLKDIVREQQFLVALIGMVVLSASVNLVELLCSAGLPAIYTQVLTMSNLSTAQYYLYMLLYIVFYMLDDLAIFFIAMITLESVGIGKKYVRAVNLIGGILMLIIGALLILKPGWLML